MKHPVGEKKSRSRDRRDDERKKQEAMPSGRRKARGPLASGESQAIILHEGWTGRQQWSARIKEYLQVQRPIRTLRRSGGSTASRENGGLVERVT